MADGIPALQGFGYGAQFGLPHRPDEVDFEIDAGEGFALGYLRGMRGSDRGVGQLADQAGMHRALLIAIIPASASISTVARPASISTIRIARVREIAVG
ncbi:MAG TPA: hypothetical protein PLL61_13860 [Thiobacillus sp.]|nr:hypothetical protein [Thiobacillus sp.]